MIRKINFKIISNLIIWVSIIFVLIYLYRANLLQPLQIKNFYYFTLSLALVLGGFLIDAIAIKIFLKFNNINLTLPSSIEMTGKYSIAKYIPGKIGVIIGKAAYVSENTSSGKYRSIEIVSVYQILFLIAGIILSMITLYNFINDQSENIIIVLVVLVLISYVFTFRKSQLFLRKMIGKVLKKDIEHVYTQKSISYVMLLTMFCWLVWGIGFWMLSLSVGIDISFNSAMLFPLASVAGVLAIISPGGLGVREGVITAGLIFFGYNESDAITLSIYSRLWFLFGEIGFFLCALAISVKKSKKLR